MVGDLRNRFRQSKDYTYDMLIRDLIEYAEELDTRFAALEETGSWVPEIRFGGNGVGITYATQSGEYLRIGRLVYLGFQVTLTAKGSSTGQATIIGIPYSAGAFGFNGSGVPGLWSGFSALGGTPVFSAAGGGINLRHPLGAGTGYVEMNETNFTNTSSIRGTMSFISPP